MTPRPLGEIGLRPRDHLSALWWLALLYRRPRAFKGALDAGNFARRLVVAGGLLAHALVPIALLVVLGRLWLFGVLGLAPERSLTDWSGTLAFHASQAAQGLALGIVVGIAGGIAFGIAGGIAYGIPAGIAGGITLGSAFGIAGGIAFGIAVGIAVGIAFGIVVGIAGGIAFGIATGIAVGTGFGVAFGTAFGIAFGIAMLRCYYHIAHPVFVWPRPRGTWYPFHPVAWDELCLVPFPGLDRLLVAYSEHDGAAGTREIERLIDHYPSQRGAALAARARLLAREAGDLTDLARLDAIVARLPEGPKGFLSQTPRVRELVGEVVRRQARYEAADRPFMREPYAEAVCMAVENFRNQVAGFSEPLASEFRAAAEKWLVIAQRQRDAARRQLGREPTPQVFRAGDPVDRDREAFVPRDRVAGQVEQQVMLASGCPGLVLYGRRRMGKSTVLYNLPGFLPPEVRVVTISMQEARAFTSLGSLVDHLTGRLRAAWPDGGPRPADGGPSDLIGLSRILEACHLALERAGRRLIVAFDEYENIDRKIREGVFPEDLLATLRESVQRHRSLTWAFAGSHAIEELSAAPWTSYLVSARTIEIPPFTEAETRLLLTEPLRHSSAWQNHPRRPRFSAEFWGEGGIERIQAEAAGWPHLVQLIAETIIDQLNREGQSRVEAAILEQALDEAIVRGHVVLYELVRGECRLPGEWAYLAGFRATETQPPPGDEAVADSLRRRWLVVEDGGDWRIRVPLMQRWLRQRS